MNRLMPNVIVPTAWKIRRLEAIAAETLAPSLTFQGRLIRPALVRLRDNQSPADTKKPTEAAEAPEAAEEKPVDELPFEAD